MSITSKKTEELTISVTLKSDVSEPMDAESEIESPLSRELRQAVTNILSDYAEHDQVESIEISYNIEDN